jgi:hypothetical protein
VKLVDLSNKLQSMLIPDDIRDQFGRVSGWTGRFTFWLTDAMAVYDMLPHLGTETTVRVTLEPDGRVVDLRGVVQDVSVQHRSFVLLETMSVKPKAA